MSIQKDQKRIGAFIRDLREERGITQSEFAQKLKTSQSAVARMEKGLQNFSLEMLSKISDVLQKEVVTLGSGATNFDIIGGKKLSGTVTTNTSKNAAVALLCASLLNRNTTTLKKMPRIEEVHRLIEVLESLGVKVVWTKDNDVIITPPKKLSLRQLNKEAAGKTRSVIMFMGPLLHLLQQFTLPHPGGCKLGKRTVRPHLFALEKFGARIHTTDNDYNISRGTLKPANIVMYEASDTATENVLMAAAKIPGKTVIRFAGSNYMVQDLCFFLEQCGVRIEGIGTSTLTVYGVKEINKPITYHPSEDPIESMMFLSIAATTQSEITIKRCPIAFLELELLKLEKMGFRYTLSREYKAKNGKTRLVDITTKKSLLNALDDKIHPQPYPGINIDNLPFFVPIATLARGTTLIHDWVFEDRVIYFLELKKLGANMTLSDPHRLTIDGPTTLNSAEVICPPALRPAVIILIAMLAAPGHSTLRNVYSINRGYEDLAKRLQKLGASIRIVKDF